MVKQLVVAFNGRAMRKTIHIGTTYGAQLPELYFGDEKRLKTVLANIISNSVHFTEAGSIHIYVDGRLKGADHVDLRIAVKDTGKGMAPDAIDRIFDRYAQIGDMTYNLSSGQSNGLAIAREFINFMGGTIRVESQLGAGSNFEINVALRVFEKGTTSVKTVALAGQAAAVKDQAA